MSLIQDALKRQAEEALRLPGQPVQPIPQIKPPEPTPPPPLSPQQQQPQQKAPEKKKTKTFPMVPFIVILTIILIALLGLSLYLIKPKPNPVPKVTQESASAEPIVIPATPEPVKVKPIEAIIEPVLLPVAEEEVVTEPVQKTKKTWPELKLTGIAQGGDRQRVAILNGKTLPAGRRLGEVAIIQVRDNNVIVEYRGERRTIYIGE